MQDIAYTLQTGREAMKLRWVAVVNNRDHLRQTLQAWLDKQPNLANVWSGRIDTTSIALLDADEDARAMISAWLAKGKLNKIAELWLKGYKIDWQAMYAPQSYRRVHLPYPFARDRYWKPEADDDPDPGNSGNNSGANSAKTTAQAVVSVAQPANAGMSQVFWQRRKCNLLQW